MIFAICPTFHITCFFPDSTLFAVQSGRGVAQKSEPCTLAVSPRVYFGLDWLQASVGLYYSTGQIRATALYLPFPPILFLAVISLIEKLNPCQVIQGLESTIRCMTLPKKIQTDLFFSFFFTGFQPVDAARKHKHINIPVKHKHTLLMCKMDPFHPVSKGPAVKEISFVTFNGPPVWTLPFPSPRTHTN